jgi:hypothetical protein
VSLRGQEAYIELIDGEGRMFGINHDEMKTRLAHDFNRLMRGSFDERANEQLTTSQLCLEARTSQV